MPVIGSSSRIAAPCEDQVVLPSASVKTARERASVVPIKPVGEQSKSRANSEGLFRGILAGPGHTMAEAFSSLESTHYMERITRHPTRDLMGVRVALQPHEGTGYWEFTRIRRDVYVVVANLAYNDPRVEFVPGEGFISLSFKVSGDMSLAVRGPKPLRWNRPSLLVWSQPTGVDTSEWTAPSAHERFVILSMRPEYLAENFFGSGTGMSEPLKDFLWNESERINYGRYPLSAQTFEVAERLIDNPYKGVLGLSYVEALAGELLCHAAGSLGSMTGKKAEDCTDRELKRLETARAILMRQLAPAPTIAELVRAVGMSKTALTKRFKAAYGETLLDFGVRCRMQHALAMMRDQRCSVEQAAEAVGYAHPTSFATAFRRQFGIRPIDVRKRIRASEAV